MSEPQTADLVLALVRGDRDGTRRLAPLARENVEGFVETCRLCDVHPWIHAELQREGLEDLFGDEVVRRLAALRTKVRMDNLVLIARAEQALDRLLSAGVVPVALKGLDLLHRLYARFDERTLDDVDLLVRGQDLRTALEVLRGAGWQVPADARLTHYVRSSHHLPMASPGPVTVEFELHWNLAQDRRYSIDAEGLVARARPLDVSGRQVLRLEDHDLVAHLLIHHFSHYFDARLKWAVDLGYLVRQPDFDWDRVADRVLEWQGTAASGASLVHLAKLVPELIPASIQRRLPLASWRRALTWPLRSSHPLELYRRTRRRPVQLYLAAVMLEHPSQLPGWLTHRLARDHRVGQNPLDITEDSR